MHRPNGAPGCISLTLRAVAPRRHRSAHKPPPTLRSPSRGRAPPSLECTYCVPTVAPHSGPIEVSRLLSGSELPAQGLLASCRPTAPTRARLTTRLLGGMPAHLTESEEAHPLRSSSALASRSDSPTISGLMVGPPTRYATFARRPRIGACCRRGRAYSHHSDASAESRPLSHIRAGGYSTGRISDDRLGPWSCWPNPHMRVPEVSDATGASDRVPIPRT